MFMLEDGLTFMLLELTPQRNLDPTQPAELADRMTDALNAAEFQDTINTFEDRQRDAVVGAAVQYLALDLPPDSLSEYMHGLHMISRSEDLAGRGNAAVHALQLDFVSRKLTDEANGTHATEEAVFNYINTHMVEHGYVYHGFNGTFRESIEEHGLSTTKREWDVQDAEAIHGILKNAGRGNALGWLFINSTDKVFATENMRDLYRYAAGSPEWFNHFSSEGMPNEPLMTNMRT